MFTDSASISGKIEQIALSLSGGGVRAVGFHLGSMSMLDRLGLLSKVEIISSVSGGSLPGLGYCLSQRFGRSFQDFFDDFFEFLPQLNILEQLLARMTTKAPPAPSGRRDMITALANIYHDEYFNRFFGEFAADGSVTFDMLLDPPRNGHVREMIFNATEFKTGSAFRFQVSDFRCLIGNGNVSICREHARKIRLADIMAASSCIPVGMEPMFFPDDFHWPDDAPVKYNRPSSERPTCDEVRAALQRNTDTQQPNFALMDGGVYDNQGITSTLLAVNRKKSGITELDTNECGFSLSHRGEPSSPQDWANWMSGKVTQGSKVQLSIEVTPEDLDLLIISDTPVRKASFFPRIPFPGSNDRAPIEQLTKPASGFMAWLEKMSIGRLDIIGKVIMGLLALSALLNIYDLWEAGWFSIDGWRPYNGLLLDLVWMLVEIVIPLMVLVALLALMIVLKLSRSKTEHSLEHIIPRWKKSPHKYLNKLRVGTLLSMASLRAGSVSALTSTIYMNRIRGLGYSAAYSRPDLHNRILANEIFTLQDAPQEQDPLHLELITRKAWPPPPEMKRIVDKAATMATKLWIEQDEGAPLNDLDYLVVGGQCTMCYNMIRFLWDRCRPGGQFMHSETEEMFDNATREWQKLIHDPLSLLNDRKSKSRLQQLNRQAAQPL
ncbi:MAG: patatin-like phospholipase family protein [Xanthomonadales bacterium]|nr:patatin-like phospholipase family protein [Xanthomonadales bacterium]